MDYNEYLIDDTSIDIITYRQNMFNEFVPMNTKIDTKFPDILRSYPFNIPNFDFIDQKKNMAVYTKTPEEYWNKSYDHFDQILKILDKIYTGSYKPYISQICNGIAGDKICEQIQDIYTLIDVYLSLYINNHDKIRDLIKIFLDFSDANKKIAVRFSIYVSVYIIKFYMHTKSYDKFTKTVYQKIKEFIAASNSDLYFIDSELDYYLKYLDGMLKK
ncbi:hypothetical protein [Acanthamoeba polyphaga mimivirus]|uniref:Uncharacterized protein n=4 Tax=Megamimivirinae TaxID=3044648 RepID=A0A2L2DLY8_MIMIV|nr:hypothetical protein MegaChil _gp0311 [Megavirus chiliensis]AEQ32896.1 hypothetical protein [Megavirus chiliensis]AEX61414.1 hypothetical protein c7_R348 [Megavirus courdo7]AVG46041.1 hypothetical protein [Acanthamoeba polyphaga mimivirus]AVG47147.1 hypothetical protein [Acanthamoeba polyphaga mimivirus]